MNGARINRLKKSLVVLLAAGTALSCAACGGHDAQEPPDASSGGAAAASGPLTPYEKEITVGLGRATQANPKLPEGDTYEDNAYTRFVAERLNIKIEDEFEAAGADYDRQVSLAIASGELPDVMRVGSQGELDELVANGLIADLTDVYAQYAADEVKKKYDSYDGRCLGAATYDGRLMAIPATRDDAAPQDVWIRQDWLDKLGLKADEDGNGCITLDELHAIAREFILKDPGGSGNPVGLAFDYTLNASDYGATGHRMTSIGAAFKAFPMLWQQDENGGVFYGSTAPAMKEALALMASWFQDGTIDPQFGTRSNDDITTLLTNNQLGIAFGPWHMPDWLFSSVRSLNPQAEFSAFAIEDASGKVNVFHGNAAGQFIVVRKDYEHPEAVLKILNLFVDVIANDPDLETNAPEVYAYQKEAVDGSARPLDIEVFTSDDLIVSYNKLKASLEGAALPEGQILTISDQVDIDSIRAYQADPGNATVADWSKYHSRMKGKALSSKLTEANVLSWTNGAFFGETPAMKQKWSHLRDLEEQSFIQIVTGAQPADYFDTYVSDWKSQGGDEISREIEEALASK